MAGAGGAGVRVCGGFFLRVFVGGRGRERGQWKERKREKAVAVEGKAKACGGFGLGWGGGGGAFSRFTPAFLAAPVCGWVRRVRRICEISPNQSGSVWFFPLFGGILSRPSTLGPGKEAVMKIVTFNYLLLLRCSN